MGTHTASGAVAGEVRAAMARAGVTATQLGTAIGMSPATLSRRLSAKSTFTIDELYDIAEHLGVSITEFTPSKAGRAEHGDGHGAGSASPIERLVS